MTTNQDEQRGRQAGPAAALAWTSTRPDLPRQPWRDQPGLPTRAAVRVDMTRREITAPTDRSTLGQTLRLRATVAGRYGLTPRQRATARRSLTDQQRPYLDTAHGLALDAMTRTAADRAGMAHTLDDGTAAAVADGVRHADAATAWRYAAPYLDEHGQLPAPIAAAMMETHPHLADALSDWAENLAEAIYGAQQLASDTESRRRQGRRHVGGLARVLAAIAAKAAKNGQSDNARNGGGQPVQVAQAGLWAALTLDLPPLTVANYARTGRTYIPTDMGRHPRYMGRALTDPARRVFQRRGGQRHATIVADLSGSMSLTDADVAAIVDAARGCSLLAYRSCRGPVTAQIVARDGRTCDPARRFRAGGGNGVDGPALTWAARNLRRHGAPLIWISDGWVTGKDEQSSPELARDMITRLRDTGAHQVENVTAALDLLAAMRAGHRPRPQICDALREMAAH